MGSWFAGLWSKQRQRAKRKATLPLVAHYWDGARSEPHQVRDISIDGMYVLTDERWYPNTLIKITLTRSDKAEEEPERSIAVTARVARAGDDGVGFAFIVPASVKALDPESTMLAEADLKGLKRFLSGLPNAGGKSLSGAA